MRLFLTKSLFAAFGLLALVLSATSMLQAQLWSFGALADSRVWAKGEWKGLTDSTHDEMAFTHEVEIDCVREARICVEAIGRIAGNGPPFVTVDLYPILRWDKNGILAEQESICATDQLNINLQSRSVVGIRTYKKGASQGGYSGCEYKSPPPTRIHELVNHHL
jgi:hypothetical protein